MDEEKLDCELDANSCAAATGRSYGGQEATRNTSRRSVVATTSTNSHHRPAASEPPAKRQAFCQPCNVVGVRNDEDFYLVDTNGKVSCKTCGIFVALSNKTQSFRAHVERRHPK